MSHLGLSGMNGNGNRQRTDGRNWTSDGRRQHQVLSMYRLPYVTTAARIPPTYQKAPYRPVRVARYFGWETSATYLSLLSALSGLKFQGGTHDGAATEPRVTLNPTMNLPIQNIASCTAAP